MTGVDETAAWGRAVAGVATVNDAQQAIATNAATGTIGNRDTRRGIIGISQDGPVPRDAILHEAFYCRQSAERLNYETSDRPSEALPGVAAECLVLSRSIGST
jgi:hypothetical protein